MDGTILKKQKEKTEVISAAIPVDMKKQLWDIADRFEVELSVIIRAAFQDFIEADKKVSNTL